MEEKKIIHKITMESREKLFLTGVEDVDSFDENEVQAYTTEGLLHIKGRELQIEKLNIESGELMIEGEIDSIVYSNAGESRGSFLSKLFR